MVIAYVQRILPEVCTYINKTIFEQKPEENTTDAQYK